MGLERRGTFAQEVQKAPATKDILATLMKWGFDAVSYLENPTGQFAVNPKTGKTYYAEQLRREIHEENGKLYLGPDNLIEISKDLLTLPKTKKLGILFARLGMGHGRVARAMDLLCQTLDIESELIDISGKKGPALFAFVREFLEGYRRGSRKTGRLNGLAAEFAPLDKKRESSKTIFTHLFKLWEKVDSVGYEGTVMGNSNGTLTPKNMEPIFKLLHAAFGPGLITHLKKEGITDVLLTYPFLWQIMKGSQFPYETIATDSLVDPLWGIQNLIAHLSISKRHMLDTWGQEYEEDVYVTNGFTAPLAALANTKRNLLSRRTESEADPDHIVTLVLPASGVATAQSKSFSDLIRTNADLVRHGKLRIIVQAGYGVEGDALTKILSEVIQNEHLETGVVLHCAQDMIAAVDFLEAITATEQSIVFGVKGSEMTLIAEQLAVPHIVTGAIGVHEQWNILFAALLGSPMILLPEAAKQMRTFLDTFPPKLWYLRDEALPILTAATCTSFEDALHMSRTYIARGKNGLTNRNTMPQILLQLFRGYGLSKQ